MLARGGSVELRRTRQFVAHLKDDPRRSVGELAAARHAGASVAVPMPEQQHTLRDSDLRRGAHSVNKACRTDSAMQIEPPTFLSASQPLVPSTDFRDR